VSGARLLGGRSFLTCIGSGLRRQATDIGVPPYSPIGPELDRCVVYSVVRTESAFDQRDVSPVKAVGLMQVIPEAGRPRTRHCQS
jgi:hypothetical protein